jgi:hypothetical protein
MWSKIQSDFKTWTPDQRDAACTRILIPLKVPVWTPGGDPKAFLRSIADINGRDGRRHGCRCGSRRRCLREGVARR